MLLKKSQAPRRGIILLVVLALITLFASIGVAFVYFAEQEANKSLDQKAGETIKLPDSDMLLNYVLKQLVYPTSNTGSALYTHSLLENMYGRSKSIGAFNGTGRRNLLNAASGQDAYYRINYQNQANVNSANLPNNNQPYNEEVHGSLNPSYTYPDHKNAFLGGVSANWVTSNFGVPATYTSYGPVAVARSFAREMVFRIAIVDAANVVVGSYGVTLNPYTNMTFANGVRHQSFWTASSGVIPIGDLPTLPVGNFYLPNTTITCSPAGVGAVINLTAADMQAHSMRPTPRAHPFFPPPGDLGGDVKNLPPEVKTLVGWNAGRPVFANNDSYWMDIGFPSLPWTNNRRIKPMAAIYIMDNDGKVNMNVAGNLRGKSGATGATFHTSAHGLTPSEINVRKLGITAADNQAMIAGSNAASVGYSTARGRGGFAGDQDPTANIDGISNTAPYGYRPIQRTAPFFSLYNSDGTADVGPFGYLTSPPWQLVGDASLPPATPSFMRFPIYANTVGFNSGAAQEWLHSVGAGVTANSPLFYSPYASSQVTTNIVAQQSAPPAITPQRTFGIQNQLALYHAKDSGAGKIVSDFAKLVPSAFVQPEQRWQMTMYSSDLNVQGIAPWIHDNGNTYQLNNTTGATNPSFRYRLPSGTSQATTSPAPTTPNPGSEFYKTGTPANYFWHSVFGNRTRLDLSRQLPDYPQPPLTTPVGPGSVPNPDGQIDYLASPITAAQFQMALQSRQKFALEMYFKLVELTHGDNAETKRWLAQLAVNIVDYIDNDDFPTWMVIPGTTANDQNIVWGTELPRLVINEVYTEAVNNTVVMNREQNNYHVRHWVELYNPLETDNNFNQWLDRGDVRLNIAGTSVYRLVITNHTNVQNIRADNNTIGHVNSTTNVGTTITNRVTFPAGTIIAASNTNYGNGTTAVGNNGFYLVGPNNPPEGATTGAVPPNTPLNFPDPHYTDANMQVSNRIADTSGTPFPDTANNRQAVLLQRLANPYLPFNPVPEAIPNTVNFAGETNNPALPYNPYITIDYVDNVVAQHAVQHNSTSSPDTVPVEQRMSFGKMQPYASVNNKNDTQSLNDTETVWLPQTPKRVYNSPVYAALQNQPQHTFLRHNGVDAYYPGAAAVVNPTQTPAGMAYNTMKLPFEWLTHLDRSPTSPVELLQVNGFKPHELTQQFNRLADVSATIPAAAPATMPPSAVVVAGNLTFTGTFHGSFNGVPWKLKQNELVRVTYVDTAGTNFTSEWVRVNTIAPDNSSFTAAVTRAGTYSPTVNVQVMVPFAHTAPWYLSNSSVANQSHAMLYRFLEAASVRHPGTDVGQIRFTSGLLANNNVGPLQADGSRWIQLDNSATSTTLHTNNQITTSDALLALSADANVTTLQAGNPANPSATNLDEQGSTLVVRILSGAYEKRATVLEIDRPGNRMRVVLYEDPTTPTPSLPAAGGTINWLALDYTYIAGRQHGKINLNTMYDQETFEALADAQNMNWFLGAAGYPDQQVDRVFRRINQQRQPGFYYGPTMVGSNSQPFQGMGAGDIAGAGQGIGSSLLSNNYQAAGAIPNYTQLVAPFANDNGDLNTFERQYRTLFEVGNPGEHHPSRRFELLSKIWNNATVRSNSFSVWITIGFFEYDEATRTLGAELGQVQGKNVRYRFFSVVDRTAVDSWLRSWQLHDTTASLDQFANSANFPTLDPRYHSYPNQQTAVSLQRAAAFPPAASEYAQDTNPGTLFGTWLVNVTAATNPYLETTAGRLVMVESNAGSEIGQVVNAPFTTISPIPTPSPAGWRLQLKLNHTGVLTVRPLPLPPTVLYWTQFK